MLSQDTHELYIALSRLSCSPPNLHICTCFMAPSSHDLSRMHSMLSLVSLRDLTLLRQLLPQYAGQPGNTNPDDRTLRLYTTECSRKASFQNIHVQLSELPQRELETIQHVLPTIFNPPHALEIDTTGNVIIPRRRSRSPIRVYRNIFAACGMVCTVSGCTKRCGKLVSQERSANYTAHIRHRCMEHRCQYES